MFVRLPDFEYVCIPSCVVGLVVVVRGCLVPYQPAANSKYKSRSSGWYWRYDKGFDRTHKTNVFVMDLFGFGSRPLPQAHVCTQFTQRQGLWGCMSSGTHETEQSCRAAYRFSFLEYSSTVVPRHE